MSTVGAWRDFGAVRSQIACVRSRWRSVLAARGILVLGVILLAAVLLVALIEGLIHLNVFGRIALASLILVSLAAALVAWVAIPLTRRITDEEVARRVECSLEGVHNGLINAVQLSRDERAPSKELVDAAISETAGVSDRLDLRSAIGTRALKRLGIVAIALAAAIGLFALLFPGRLGNALLRVIHPADLSLAVAGRVEIVSLSPGTSPVVVPFGESLDVRVSYRCARPETVKATFVWEYATGEKREMEMARMASDSPLPGLSAFEYRIPSVEVPFSYHVKLDDTASARFDVEILQRPEVESADIEYHYPKYTGLETKTESGSKSGAVEAPMGTEASIRAHVTREVMGGQLRFDGNASDVPLVVVDGRREKGNVLGRTVQGAIFVARDATYAFNLIDPSERASMETGRRTIHAIPDRKPVAEVLSPARDSSAAPGETVKLAVRVSDDYGVTQATLFMKRGDELPTTLGTWSKFDNPRADTVSFALELKPESYKSGEILSVWCEVKDNCELGDRSTWHQSALSAVRLISVRDKGVEAKQAAEDVRGWKDRLEEILRTQQRSRAATSTLEPAMERGEFLLRAGSVSKDQLDVYQKTFALADDMQKVDGEAARIARTTLAMLARNEMVRASGIAGTVAKIEKLADLPSQRDDLLALQDKIIATLKKVLDILPMIEKEALGEKPGDASTEMPQDSKKAWKDLADKLKDFIDEQKKVIADSQDLAKKPVDDFTEADKDKLKELAAVEDEWSKYMKEAYKDLSKLPNQDFSNPSLLKELLAVQEDVQKAADALTRKAVELSVPLEQSGVENAKEMTTHIEKWLPDSADRQQWKMEEPVEDLETPMAELPKELEDIVGDLMENEEDLFQEVEDASSAWSDSIDKGAGWDAADGPISNMSAQGVTGNQLPNSSEIGGRSGEGRSGKSSGEMVGDEASGKGGRRTPTRLTPDAYEKGEVKDSSPESAGGSTGGGKVSGASKEGLEGPVPPQTQRKMERLAGKQADIRNTAERVNIAFKVLKYPTTELEKAIADMKQTEDDLKNYRYDNALRRKRIMIKGLETAKMMTESRVKVGRDFSAGLPPEVRREILDASEQQLPPEYRDLVEKYYESLSEK